MMDEYAATKDTRTAIQSTIVWKMKGSFMESSSFFQRNEMKDSDRMVDFPTVETDRGKR